MMCRRDGTHTRGLLALAFAVCLFGGCAQGPGKEDLSNEEKHILKITSLCIDFKGAHAGVSPRDVQELKEWAKGLKKEQLASHGIENLDDAFISPRDHQPYVLVKPEQARPGPGGRPAMLWVYEKTGVNGKRMCANAMGYAFETDEAEFKKLQGGGK